MKCAPLLLSSFLAICGTLGWSSRMFVFAIPDNGTLVSGSEGPLVKRTTQVPPSVETLPSEQFPPGNIDSQDPGNIDSQDPGNRYLRYCGGEPNSSIKTAYRHYLADNYGEFKISLVIAQDCIKHFIQISGNSSNSLSSNSELVSLAYADKIGDFLYAYEMAQEEGRKICWPNDIVVPNVVGKTCSEDPDPDPNPEDPDPDPNPEDPDPDPNPEDPDPDPNPEDPDPDPNPEDPDPDPNPEDPDPDPNPEDPDPDPNPEDSDPDPPTASTNNWDQGFVVLLMGLILGGGSLIVLLLRQSRLRSVQKTRLNQPDSSDVALLQEVTEDRTKN